MLLTEWDKKKLDEAKKIVKNIKDNINKNNPLTFEDAKQLYSIFAKNSWIVEKFSPNIIRQNDFLIKTLMYEIMAPLDKEKSAVNEFNMNVSNDNNNIINDNKPKSLLDAIFNQDFSDNNESEEVKKYRVFFDFLAQYSGYGDTIKDKSKWNYNDCMLVEEFIKDKEFEMYEDIEELPECCKRIYEIKSICEQNIIYNNEYHKKYMKNVDDVLQEKYKSLEMQLDKICKQDKRLKDGSEDLKKAIKDFKDKINKTQNSLSDFHNVQAQDEPTNLANNIITAMNNGPSQTNLVDANKRHTIIK